MFYFLILLIFSTANALTKVSVFYESLCPDSVDFITEQLYPNYKALKGKISLDFVPYGKASHSLGEKGWHFRCQHGQNECIGNLYQACALNQKKGQDKDVEFVNCAMSSFDASSFEEIEKCAKKFGFDSESIKQCEKNGTGHEYLAKYGTLTHNLTPKLRFVPTIVLNDKFDESVQSESLYDFLQVACKALAEKDKPAVCGK